jgi:hypothetical protein
MGRLMADFDDLKKWVTDAWDAQQEWREAAEDDFAFVDGHQWTDAERADMEEQSRIPIVFNRTAVIIGSVAGSEINNRTEVRFIPREIGDVRPNEVLTAGGEWFRDQAAAEDADSTAFEHLLVCGLGVTETGLDWDDDPEGEPTIEAVDPLEFFWDRHAHRKGLADARYMGRVRQMPAEEAEERFEGKDASEIDCSNWIKAAGSAKKLTDTLGDEYASGGEDDVEGESPHTVTVVQLQWRERRKFVEYVSPATGQRDEMPKADWDKVIKRVPLNIPHRAYSKWVWQQAFLGRDKILDQNQPDPDGATFTAMTGHWDRKDKRFYGLLRSMRDPQKFANKWLSQTLHIINSNAKGGVMYEEDAVADPSEFEEAWAAADSAQPVRPGALSGGKIQEKPKAAMPAALMALTEFAISAIRDTSGVNMELLGLRDANQPGVLEYQRRQSAMTTMARFFDSLRFYRKRQGRTIFNFLRNHIAPTGRLVRLVKEEQVQYVPLAVDTGSQKYDVIVDDAPSAPNEKEKAWSVIQAMMPMLQNAGLSMEDWADILEYSPLPSSFADKVREKASKQGQQPDPMQAMQLQSAQLEMQKTQSEIAENVANAARDQMQMQIDAQEAQLQPIRTLAELMKAQPSPMMGASPAGASTGFV